MLKLGKKFSKPNLSRIINGDVSLIKAPELTPKIRLDLLLLKYYPSYNRSTLQKFITAGYVKVNNEVALKANLKFSPDVKIELLLPKKPKNSDLKPTIIYEDDNVLVLNKPVGLLSMPRNKVCPEKTLEDYGLLVHRLDRATSGIIILAKNLSTQEFLRKQFQSRTTHKIYYAIVIGHPKLNEAKIDLPIARNFKRPTTFCIDPNGKSAETDYKVLEHSHKFSLLELKPKTGRTHQLRVHLQYLGTPILGDPLYGGVFQSILPMPPKFSRLYLHAYSLEITLPGGIRQTFTAPLPKDFKLPLKG